MKTKVLKVAMLTICCIVVISSCQKEETKVEEVKQIETWKTIEDYPSEITTENWEEFVYAPKHVMAHFEAMESSDRGSREINSNERHDEKVIMKPPGIACGLIQFWRGYGDNQKLIPFPGVSLSVCGYTSETVDVFEDAVKNYLMPNPCGGFSIFCTTIEAPEIITDPACDKSSLIVGVTAFDLVLIQKHILGIAPFTEAAQFVAADVTRDGLVNAADVTEIWGLLLGKFDDWITSPNYVFVNKIDYDIANELIETTGDLDVLSLSEYGSTNDCTIIISSNNRVGVKTGDVNGTLSNCF